MVGGVQIRTSVGLRPLKLTGHMSGPEGCLWGGSGGVEENHRVRSNEDTGRWAEVATTFHG